LPSRHYPPPQPPAQLSPRSWEFTSLFGSNYVLQAVSTMNKKSLLTDWSAHLGPERHLDGFQLAGCFPIHCSVGITVYCTHVCTIIATCTCNSLQFCKTCAAGEHICS